MKITSDDTIKGFTLVCLQKNVPKNRGIAILFENNQTGRLGDLRKERAF